MGWGRARLSFMATGGEGEKGTLEVNTPHCGDPSARPSLSLERPVAHAVCRPHPQAVEGDFTFVTIIHLIGFQLSGRGSGGCLCESSFLLGTSKGAQEDDEWPSCGIWKSLPAGKVDRTGVCYHPNLSGACGSNPAGLHPVSRGAGASPSPWGSPPLENRVGSQGKGAWRSADAPTSSALWVLSGMAAADSVPVSWLHGCVSGVPRGPGESGTHETLGNLSTFLHPDAGFSLCHLSSVYVCVV